MFDYLLLLKAFAILMALHAKKKSYFLRNMWLYYTTNIQVKTKHVWVQQLTFGSATHHFWTTSLWQTWFTSLTQNFMSMKFKKVLTENYEIAVAQWLRCCATNWKVTGSIPAGVGIFHWHKILPIRTMALRSTQPLTEMSTRSISWG